MPGEGFLKPTATFTQFMHYKHQCMLQPCIIYRSSANYHHQPCYNIIQWTEIMCTCAQVSTSSWTQRKSPINLAWCRWGSWLGLISLCHHVDCAYEPFASIWVIHSMRWRLLDATGWWINWLWHDILISKTPLEDTVKEIEVSITILSRWHQGPALLTLKSFYLKAFSRKHGCDWLMLKHQPITATLSAKSF